ncbi:MAG: crosslink repair DNA glycosylase YcaQ family protein, partial [Propionicimonas sp.]|nr:crosslink repair DNA glycosylase YcaQ family protein [Propionicimonas sp.]
MLAAQGFGRVPPERASGDVTIRHLQQVVDRVGHFQIDTVNVAVRAQYMPLFARLGRYDRGLLERAAGVRPRRVFEYWVRNAVSHIDIALYPAFRHRMDEQVAKPWRWVTRMSQEHPELLDKIRRQVAAAGPLTARQIEHPDNRERGAWWNWSDAKIGLEWL